MTRPRKEGRTDLPQNLHVQNRKGGEYFNYHSPVTKRSVALGYNKQEAVRYALQANLEVGYIDDLRDAHRASMRHGNLDSKGLLDVASIVRKSIRYDQICGIYFLIRGQEIVYIGQSMNVLSRLSQHYAEQTKVFDSFYLLECREANLNHTEALYIAKFAPIYNITKPFVPAHIVAWSGSLTDLLGMS